MSQPIDLLSAIHGGLPRYVRCAYCDGQGSRALVIGDVHRYRWQCPFCKGTGFLGTMLPPPPWEKINENLSLPRS